MKQSVNAERRKTVVLMALAENFGKELSPVLLNLWLDLLSPYPAEQVEEATRKVIEEYAYKTLPPFAILKKALDSVYGESDADIEIQANAEWGILIESIRSVGFYGKKELHPTTSYVLRLLGGWSVACQWNLREIDFRRKEFIRMWINSHDKIELMQLGAEGYQHAVKTRNNNRPIGDFIKITCTKFLGE